MQENKTSNRIISGTVYRLFAVMLLATLISCHVISGTMAKYVTGADGASDTARVAKFSVTALGDEENPDSLSLKFGTDDKTKNYNITVTNDSEVAVRYTVKITFLYDVNGKLTAKLTAELGDTAGVYDASTRTFTWSNAGSLEAKGATADSDELFLSLTAESGILPGEDDKVTSTFVTYDFTTDVTFEQID